MRGLDPFFRSEENARSQDSRHGIGMSIAQWIVQAHGGKSAYASGRKAALTFTVSMTANSVPAPWRGSARNHSFTQRATPPAGSKRRSAMPSRKHQGIARRGQQAPEDHDRHGHCDFRPASPVPSAKMAAGRARRRGKRGGVISTEATALRRRGAVSRFPRAPSYATRCQNARSS